MAAKEAVGKSKLFIVLSIPYQNSLSSFYFIQFKGHRFRISKDNFQKAILNLSKNHKICFVYVFKCIESLNELTCTLNTIAKELSTMGGSEVSG